MPTLEVEPIGRFSWGFRVRSGGRELTTLALTRFRDRAVFTLDGVQYSVEVEGFFRRVYRLERGGVAVARAETRGFLRPDFVVTAGDRVLTMRPQGFLGFTFVVEHGRTALGEIRRQGAFTRRTTVDLDDRIDPPCRIFLIFLTQVQWRRQARRSG